MARILIVDDERPILNVLRVLVKSLGHEPVICDDGRAALEWIESGDNFDVMLSDLRMSPLNGMELLRGAKRAKPDLPVILVSAYLSEENWAEARLLGAHGSLSKPFRPDQLAAKIDAALTGDPPEE